MHWYVAICVCARGYLVFETLIRKASQPTQPAPVTRLCPAPTLWDYRSVSSHLVLIVTD